MNALSIDNLTDEERARLALLAAEHGRSPEAEAVEILRRALGEASDSDGAPTGLGSRIRAIVQEHGGGELSEPKRSAPRRSRFDSDGTDTVATTADILDGVRHLRGRRL